MSIGALYGYDEAGELTGYSADTIKVYCDRGILKKGRDFVLRYYRYGPRPRVYRQLTETGIFALNTRGGRRGKRP
jgi:hypothetical protein